MALPVKLQPGDIIFTRDWTPISWLIRLEEGDFSYSHVCIVGTKGQIWTTGAKKLLWFGAVDPEVYLKGKQFAVRRFPALKTIQQIDINAWCATQKDDIYPFWKELDLMFLGLRGMLVKRQPGVEDKKRTYCAESVALALQSAGIDTGEVRADAQTPETIWNLPGLITVYEG